MIMKRIIKTGSNFASHRFFRELSNPIESHQPAPVIGASPGMNLEQDESVQLAQELHFLRHEHTWLKSEIDRQSELNAKLRAAPVQTATHDPNWSAHTQDGQVRAHPNAQPASASVNASIALVQQTSVPPPSECHRSG